MPTACAGKRRRGKLRQLFPSVILGLNNYWAEIEEISPRRNASGDGTPFHNAARPPRPPELPHPLRILRPRGAAFPSRSRRLLLQSYGSSTLAAAQLRSSAVLLAFALAGYGRSRLRSCALARVRARRLAPLPPQNPSSSHRSYYARRRLEAVAASRHVSSPWRRLLQNPEPFPRHGVSLAGRRRLAEEAEGLLVRRRRRRVAAGATLLRLGHRARAARRQGARGVGRRRRGAEGEEEADRGHGRGEEDGAVAARGRHEIWSW